MTILELWEKCNQIEFPQTVLKESSLRNNFRNLLFNEKLGKYSNTCTQLIQHFHPSLWKAYKKGRRSPYEAWYDKNCLEKAFKNRVKYMGEDLSPRDIRRGLTLSGVAPKISIFRPSTAKYLIKKYLDKYEEIFDPCSGYSGRLLGAASLKKKYIGQDINLTTVKESNKLIEYFHLDNCSVIHKNSLATKGKYQCLFTCPPYSDLENWNQDIEELTCDEWIDECLNNFDCETYLFVVDKTEKYKKYIIEELENTSCLSQNKEYVIKIEKLN